MIGITSETPLDLDHHPVVSRSRLVLARFSVGLVAVSAVVFVTVLTLWATAIPLFLGWNAAAITSGSMEPLIAVGDVLVAEPYGDQELQPGVRLSQKKS